MRTLCRYSILLLMMTIISFDVFSQQHPERRHIRHGNKDYEVMEYGKAEEAYRKAAVKTPQSMEAQFNLADALYKQERFEEAENTLKNLLSKEYEMSSTQKAQAYYNLGNSQFAQNKLNDALESFKQSLRLNPDDKEAKYNYVYTKKLLEKNQNDNNQNNQNQNNDNPNNQNNQNQNDQNQENQNSPDNGSNDQNDAPDKNNDSNNDDGDGNGSGNDNQSSPPQNNGSSPDESGISRNEAEQILNAIQGQEDKTREKVDAQKAVAVGASGKNW